jgi:hypothetical protein
MHYRCITVVSVITSTLTSMCSWPITLVVCSAQLQDKSYISKEYKINQWFGLESRHWVIRIYMNWTDNQSPCPAFRKHLILYQNTNKPQSVTPMLLCLINYYDIMCPLYFAVLTMKSVIFMHSTCTRAHTVASSTPGWYIKYYLTNSSLRCHRHVYWYGQKTTYPKARITIVMLRLVFLSIRIVS